MDNAMHKFKAETFFTIDYNDFDKIVQEWLATDEFEIVAIEELSNDSSSEFSVGPGRHDWYEKFDKKIVEKIFKTGKVPCYCLSAVAQGMYEDGVLNEGSYLVRVCW